MKKSTEEQPRDMPKKICKLLFDYYDVIPINYLKKHTMSFFQDKPIKPILKSSTSKIYCGEQATCLQSYSLVLILHHYKNRGKVFFEPRETDVECQITHIQF